MYRVLTPLIDVLFVVAFGPAVGFLAGQFRAPSIWNGLLVSVVYLLLCGAVYLLRRLGTPSRPPEGFVWLLAAQGLLFGIFIGYLAWESSGLMNNLLASDPADVHPGLMAAMLAGIALAFLYPAVIAVPVAPTPPRSTTVGPIVRAAALVVINAAAMMVFAFWDVMFADATRYDGLETGGKLMVFAAAYLFYWLFFGAPRMLPLVLNFSKVELGAAVLSTGYWVWQSLARSAW